MMFLTKVLSTVAAGLVPLVCCNNVVRSATPTTDEITYPTQGASFAADGETSTITWYVTSNNGDGPQSYNVYLIKGVSNILVDNLSTGFTSDGAGENSDDWYVSTNYADGFDYKIKIAYNSTFVLYSDTFTIFGSHNDTTGLNDPHSSSSTSPGAGTVTATVTAAPSNQAQPSVFTNSPVTVTTSIGPARPATSSPSSTHTTQNGSQTTNPSPSSTSSGSTTASPASKSSSTSTATLAGAVAGSIGGILLLIGIIFYLVRRYCSCAVTRKERPMSTRIRSGHFPPAIAWDDRPPTAAELALSAARPNTAEVHGDSSTRQELDSDTYANEKAASRVKHVSMQEQMQRQPPRRMTERWELDGEV